MAECGLQIEHLPVLLPALSEHPLSQGFPVSGLLKSDRMFVFGGDSLGTLKASQWSPTDSILDCLGVPA